MGEPDWVYAALEAARKRWDAEFYVAMCENSARPELLKNGTFTREEHRQAVADLRAAKDALIDAEAEMIRHFSDESGYPMSESELRAKFAAEVPRDAAHSTLDMTEQRT